MCSRPSSTSSTRWRRCTRPCARALRRAAGLQDQRGGQIVDSRCAQHAHNAKKMQDLFYDRRHMSMDEVALQVKATKRKGRVLFDKTLDKGIDISCCREFSMAGVSRRTWRRTTSMLWMAEPSQRGKLECKQGTVARERLAHSQGQGDRLLLGEKRRASEAVARADGLATLRASTTRVAPRAQVTRVSMNVADPAERSRRAQLSVCTLSRPIACA